MSGRITKRDADLIKEFIAEWKAPANIGLSRANKFANILTGWKRVLGAYQELSIADLYVGINLIKHCLTMNGTLFKQNSKHDGVRILRQFLISVCGEASRGVRAVLCQGGDGVERGEGDLLKDSKFF